MQPTEKQQEVLRFIENYFASHQIAPSVREIAAALGKSKQAIQQHIESLRTKGYLEHRPAQSRANIPIKRQPFIRDEFSQVPILGRVQAGLPLLAEENLEGTIPLPREWARGDHLFMLRVKGDSMRNAHIVDGDLVLVRQQANAENGEIVVARLRGAEVTLKRLYRRGHKVILKAENPRYAAIQVPAGEAEIVGKAIGVYRRLG
jgi:repressor LexA